MRIEPLHSWNLTPTEAVALQRQLAEQVETTTPLVRCELIAGADVSYRRFSKTIYAGVVVLHLPDLTVVEKKGVTTQATFPYVPGLLSFRETPPLLEAFALLESVPDAIMLDGQGQAHPRRFGYACHTGLWLQKPCFGCAKSLLVGEYKRLGKKAGSVAPLRHRDEVVGQAVRTKDNVKPVFVSAGHRINLQSAVRLVLEACRGYRIPEPTRQAHLYVNELRRQGGD